MAVVQLSGTITGSGALAAPIIVAQTYDLAAALDAGATITADIEVVTTHNLAADLDAGMTVTAAASISPKELAADLDAGLTLTADIEVVTTHDLAAVLSAGGTFAAALQHLDSFAQGAQCSNIDTVVQERDLEFQRDIRARLEFTLIDDKNSRIDLSASSVILNIWDPEDGQAKITLTNTSADHYDATEGLTRFIINISEYSDWAGEFGLMNWRYSVKRTTDGVDYYHQCGRWDTTRVLGDS